MTGDPWVALVVNLVEAPPEAARCSACLDSRRCWVCLGQGATEDRYGRRQPCAACSGTGVCPHCLSVPAQRGAAD
jgi:hypothetical protein